MRRILNIVLILSVVFGYLSLSSANSVKAQTGTPNLILTKTIDDNITTAQVGDVIRYRIRFECSSLVGPCGEMEITDVLPVGLIYLPPPASSVPAGFTIAYNDPTRTVTIRKVDNNLLDGSQYDAVLAVSVDYDFRPLPQAITNTVTGRIDPPGPTSWLTATPASAPPVTIEGVAANWQMTKTLYSPSIEPTVDTNVTYRLQLCPVGGSGNVPLRNIIMTDILPVGSVFVSASDGGTESGGVVTWPNITGPVYPPNCITRYATILYPSTINPGTGLPYFAIGDTVSNTASADGEYTDTGGHIIGPGEDLDTEPIGHDIDPISEIPTYSKNDVGDPVGFNGTARFVLNLNTNGTNYPSEDAILIDNLPAQLEVLQVTSGTWNAPHVQAYIEYSTDYAESYTAFSGQPASGSSNATYTAPAANITNVRWRFQYDPDGTAPYTYTEDGLPFSWSFATSPQIRVTPREADTTADDLASTAMPAAVAGTTYNNCLQVSRTNSTGTAALDDCNNETMTVQGNIVSLRVSKTETPGTGWDDLDDPDIDAFVPDTAILPGDTVRYTISVELTERSSANLVNPVIQDIIPAGFIFVRNGTARLDNTALPSNQQPNLTQAGNTLTWDWDSSVPPLTISPSTYESHTLTVEFFGYIQRGQSPGTYSNDLRVNPNAASVVCEIPGTQSTDTTDIDGDTNLTEAVCRNPDAYVVERSAALRGEKWVRATDVENIVVVDSTTFLPDATCPNGGSVGLPGSTNPFTRYPCIAQAVPEGALSIGQLVPPATGTTRDDFEYNLRIFNDGNVPMLEYVLYDILPYTGDTGSGGTLTNSARLSEFRPVLRGAIEFISGPSGLSVNDFTIEYNNTTNPCRPEVFNRPVGTLIPTGCNNTWSSTWSEAARSYRIRLNDNGEPTDPGFPAHIIAPSSTSDEVRFGVPMYIPKDSPTVGVFDWDDAVAKEIAWNSFSHVGSYDKDENELDTVVDIQDLLASEPRKVGITLPEVMSVGNRVWRDSDNSGTINEPDDSTPGIAGVVVNLYRDTDDNGVPDGAAVAFTTTDTGGYYLFSNIPYDRVDDDNNRYIIGVPAVNFNPTNPLYLLRSSTGPQTAQAYLNPDADNGDRNDNGINPAVQGNEVLSASFMLEPTTEPTTEADLSANDRDGPEGRRRGVNGEIDENSDLTLDFGFFGGTDIPFSIGNHVWYDNGVGSGGVINDGIRQSGEPPVVGVTVRLYRDGNYNGVPDVYEMIRTDVTDENGFYLFDNLDPGSYYVEIPAAEFATGRPLAGWYSSQTTGSENIGVTGNTNTPVNDSDDNGVDSEWPETYGIYSGVIVLTRGIPETTGENHLSNQADPDGNPLTEHLGINPTEYDGPNSIGRYGETDDTSNVTVDFGFIPPMSLGNRVWIDEGAGTTPFRAGFNDGLQNGTETGVGGVRVELWRDTNTTPGLQVAGDTFVRYTTTDGLGYYLFDRLQPGDDYFIHIPMANFTGSGPLVGYVSSYDTNQTTGPNDDFEDMDDNGVDSLSSPTTTGISSTKIEMAYTTEPVTPTDEKDISGDTTAYGTGNVGLFGQTDTNSNLTQDFGFIHPPRSLGNYLWFDANNDRIRQTTELPVPAGVRVSLYMDSNGDGVVDDLGTTGNYTDDWVAYDITDAGGFYLFDNLPAGRYIIGVDYTNFASGGLLEGYNSSTGAENNSTNDTDSRDNGVDRLYRANPVYSPYGIITNSINMSAATVNAPTTESLLSSDTGILPGINPTEDDGPLSRGRYGETNEDSDLTIDFGFFQPMSIGNRVFRDDGAGGGVYNDGIMNGTESGIFNVLVELFRDTNGDGTPDGSRILYDRTDANGYYLFDNVAAGSYVIRIPSSNFSGVLTNLISSYPTGSENVGVTGNTYTPNTDRDDNGINAAVPTATGVLSQTIVLVNNNEPPLESELSGQADTGAPANIAFNPTGWDGPGSIGRFEESDVNSNITIDFGFVSPPRSLGNYLWLDANNDGAWSAGELPVLEGVRVSLYQDSDGDGVVDDLGVLGSTTDDAIAFDLSDANGYYLFDNLPPNRYIVGVDTANFATSGLLVGYNSSTGSVDNAANNTDSLDNGLDRLYRSDATLSPYGIITTSINMTGVTVNAPTGEALSGNTSMTAGNNPTAGDGSGSIGRNGETDVNSDLTIDFGFFRPMSIGNRVFVDSGEGGGGYNNAIMDGTESGVANVRVELYRGASLIGFDITDANGFYLFDNVPEGTYTVRIPAGNFTDSFDVDGTGPLPAAVGALLGLNSSTLTGEEDSGVSGNLNIPNTDRDDNGINNGTPQVNGVQSGLIVLEYNNEPINESELSGQADTGAPTNITFNPTGWDGPYTASPLDGSRGRFEEADNNSNITIDFGFVPVFSLGNRVWFDTNNSSSIDGAEVGIENVRVQLFDTTGTTEIPVGPDGILETADDAAGGVLTDADGYYLFNNLLPGDYTIVLPASNFNEASPSHPLAGYYSSGTTRLNDGSLSESTAADANTDTDLDDNGMLQNSGTFNGGVIASTVTLGPGIADEPAAESDLAIAGEQGQPDRQANMTVDFGFYHMEIGNLVWGDVNNNGVLDGSTESGIPGVTVELWPAVVGPTTTALASTITDSNGEYYFEDLPAGTEAYIVRIPALEFEGTETLRNFRSSTGGGTEPAQDTDANFADSDDNGEETNGILGLGGYIQTLPITLSPRAEQMYDDATGLTTENRVDFGVFNGPQVDLAVTKDDGQDFYLADSTLNYTITFTNNGPADISGAVVSDTMPSQIDTWTWTCHSATPATPADYGCDGGTATPFSDTIDLPYGASLTYTVAAHVLATATGQLDNTAVITPPSGISETDTDNNTDTDTDQPASLTIDKDDGVTLIAPNTVLTYHIIIRNTGTVALDSLIVTDNLPDYVTFIRAYRGAVDFPPTISAVDTLTWNAASFGTLASGATFEFDIEVRVNNSISVSSITNPIEIEDTDTGASDEDDDTDNLINTNIKVLTGTSETDSGTASPALPIDPEPVFIGELLTYTVRLDIPTGTADDLQLLDIMDSGLAFVRCTGVTAGSALSTTLTGGFNTACTSPTVSAEPVGSLVTENQGRRVLFDFGDVTSTAMDTITITYEAVVLDIAANTNGIGDLNNHVTWTWDTISSISDEATPVEIDEPELVVEKTARPTTAMYGTPITFTLEVSHAAISAAPAYDVILTDVLPAGLAYIPLSATSTGLAPNDMDNIYNPTTSTLTFEWDVFPLAATSTITFQATFVGPSPVANEASLEWTSIEIDPQLDGSPEQRSPYNIHSTERWYDPLDQTINDYRASDSVRIQTPDNNLPLTGFKLGESTVLPLQPEAKTYTDLGKMWLEIPKLKLKMPITGVPYVKNDWDLTWLSDQAGYLEGSTFPGQVGNTAITAHVVLADGTPGPFQSIDKLLWGDQIILHINGEKFIYELRQSINVLPSDYSLFRYDGYSWVTLITCDEYNKTTDTYLKRTLVKAVLVKTEVE